VTGEAETAHSFPMLRRRATSHWPISCARFWRAARRRHERVCSSTEGRWRRSKDVGDRGPTPSTSSGEHLVHGGSLRGWGSPATPEPVLLVPRGFDASKNRFLYDVNPRFADTRPDRTLLRNPFRIVIDVSFNLSTNFDLQQLRRAVEPVKGPQGWQRRSADSLAAFYLSNTSDVYRLLMEQSDSLLLTNSQVAVIQRADSVFSSRIRALYIPLGEFLARGQGGAGKAELDSVQATQKTYWKIFWEQPEIAGDVLTPVQMDLLPFFKVMLATPKKEREHSEWRFGHPVTFADKPKAASP